MATGEQAATACWRLPEIDDLPPSDHRRVRAIGLPWWSEYAAAFGLASVGLGCVAIGVSDSDWIVALLGIGMLIGSPFQMRSGFEIGPSDIVVHDVRRSQTVRWEDVVRFDLTRYGGRSPRDVLTIYRSTGKPIRVHSVSVPRSVIGVWASRSARLHDEPAIALARTVPDLVTDLEHLRRTLTSKSD